MLGCGVEYARANTVGLCLTTSAPEASTRLRILKPSWALLPAEAPRRVSVLIVQCTDSCMKYTLIVFALVFVLLP